MRIYGLNRRRVFPLNRLARLQKISEVGVRARKNKTATFCFFLLPFLESLDDSLDGVRIRDLSAALGAHFGFAAVLLKCQHF